MIIANATTTASPAPSALSDVTRTNAQQFVSTAQNSQKTQPSAIVQLSTQGQLLSRSDRPGSTGESAETQSKEAAESPAVQFMEGESGSKAAPAPTTAASNGVSAYLKTAAA